MAGDITVPRAARIVRIISDIALALYTFFLPWPHTPALKSILFGAAVVSWLVGSFVQGKKLLRRSPLDWYIAAVTITVLLSCLFSISPSYSFNNLQSEFLWHLGLYFLLIFSIDDVSRLKILMVALLLSVTVITGYGVYGYLHNTGVKVDGLVGARATSVLPSFGRVAFYISLAFPIIFSWFLHERRRWLLWILGLSSGLTILFLILTFARGSWLSIFLAIGLLSTLRDRRILALLLVAIIISPLFMPDNVMQRGASFFYMRHYRTSAIMG
ncbi:hypothetical protein JW905_16615, partial [bacterium]|nr:hypothetical protein [candidate division CSSED10-310 bacterium]